MINEICYVKRDHIRHGYRRMILGRLPWKLLAQLRYRKQYGQNANLKHPEMMDEKLLVLQHRYNSDPLVSRCTDKYAVRGYLQEKGLGDILTELYGVYRHASEIDWDQLPSQYVLKCNHGCGWNIIVKDSAALDRAAAAKELDGWLKVNYGKLWMEHHYRAIPPRIIAEEYMEDETGNVPPDYKFFVANGKVLCCLVIVGRFTDWESNMIVDNDFNLLDYVAEDEERGGYKGDDFAKFKPDCFEEMQEIACKLGQDFPFVRVDLYQYHGKVKFGELTFTPHGCINNHFNMKAQLALGKQITL